MKSELLDTLKNFVEIINSIDWKIILSTISLFIAIRLNRIFYRRELRKKQIDLVIEDEALDYIVDKAIEFKLGGRGLRSICELVLTDAMYDLPSSDEKTLHIEKSYAEHTLNKNMLQRLKAVS